MKNEDAAYRDTEVADGGVQCRKKLEKDSHVTTPKAPWIALPRCKYLYVQAPLVRHPKKRFQ